VRPVYINITGILILAIPVHYQFIIGNLTQKQSIVAFNIVPPACLCGFLYYTLPGGPAKASRSVCGHTLHGLGSGSRCGSVEEGPRGNVTVGTAVGTLPDAYVTTYVGNQTYYYDGSTYYQQCYQGVDVNYCVVSDPNQ
jgi:hypothetical protein